MIRHPEYSDEVRKFPEEWARRIASAFPLSETVSWLLGKWEKGNPWEPINRWVVWHMRHPKLLEGRPDFLDLMKELKGPDPRSTGHYCATGACQCAEKAGRWFGGAAWHIDRQQWELFQETGHFGTRWWVVQGDEGGHRYKLDRVEARISKIMGGPDDTPAPGDLPYADFDARAFNKIALMDKVRQWKGVSDWASRNADTLDAEEKAAEQEANAALWEWMGLKSKRRVELLSNAEKQAVWDSRPSGLGKAGSQDRKLDYDKIHESFITDGTY